MICFLVALVIMLHTAIARKSLSYDHNVSGFCTVIHNAHRFSILILLSPSIALCTTSVKLLCCIYTSVCVKEFSSSSRTTTVVPLLKVSNCGSRTSSTSVMFIDCKIKYPLCRTMRNCEWKFLSVCVYGGWKRGAANFSRRVAAVLLRWRVRDAKN